MQLSSLSRKVCLYIYRSIYVYMFKLGMFVCMSTVYLYVYLSLSICACTHTCMRMKAILTSFKRTKCPRRPNKKLTKQHQKDEAKEYCDGIIFQQFCLSLVLARVVLSMICLFITLTCIMGQNLVWRGFGISFLIDPFFYRLTICLSQFRTAVTRSWAALRHCRVHEIGVYPFKVRY